MNLNELSHNLKKYFEKLNRKDKSKIVNDHNKIKAVASVIAVLFAFVHIIWPSLGIDLTSITLILIAILLWYLPYLKSVKLPGGFEIELKDTKSATDKVTSVIIGSNDVILNKRRAASVGLDAILEKEEDYIKTLKQVAESDPNLAFVGFRIEIEKRLLKLDNHR